MYAGKVGRKRKKLNLATVNVYSRTHTKITQQWKSTLSENYWMKRIPLVAVRLYWVGTWLSLDFFLFPVAQVRYIKILT